MGLVKWTKRMRNHLGTLPDVRVAEILGISSTAVQKERERMGILPYKAVGRPNLPWAKWEIALLGKHSDRAVAERLGIGESTVIRKRKELGIPGHRRGKKK